MPQLDESIRYLLRSQISRYLTTGDKVDSNPDTTNDINLPSQVLLSGTNTAAVNNVVLAIIDSLYNGGIDDGTNTAAVNNVVLAITDSLYNGGIDDGTNTAAVYNVVLAIIDSLYNGGIDDGTNTATVNNVFLAIIDSSYNGGIGRGEIQKIAADINLTICGDTLIWNGNANINWDNPDNWDCGIVPGINSTVIIPTGKARYPTIFFNAEIKKLEIRIGGVLTVFTGKILLLNGH